MRTSLLIVGFVVLSSAANAASRPVVVELFTSEGCSSCPPADVYLTELAKRSDVLPLAFHVTYWNALGWRDPFSFEGATSRQATYAAKLGGGSFTPEVVIDGRRGLIGSDREEVAAAIIAARQTALADISVDLRHSAVGVTVVVGSGQGRGTILLVGFDHQHQTSIGRGENSGRTLLESNIVRSVRVIGAYEGRALHLTSARPTGEDAAVILQAADGSILGAARL